MRRTLLVILFVSMALAACTTQAPSAIPTALKVVSPSATPGDSPTPTETEWPTPYFPPTSTPRPSATARPLSTEDEFAFAQMKALGHGVNLGNALEAPKEGDWGVTLKQEYFDLIQTAGFQSVRVPINWDGHTDQKSPYTIDPAFFQRVDWVVEQGHKHNLAVILNIHNFNEGINTAPEKHKERFLAVWKQIAEHYKDQPDSVYFELLNEPHGTITDTDAWNQIVAQAIAVIRISNPRRSIILGPGGYNDVHQLETLKLPEKERNIIVTFHYYNPFHFTHQGADWVKDSGGWMGTTWNSTPAEQAAISQEFDIAMQWGKREARPIFLGEFGAYSKGDMPSRERWTTFVAREAEKRGFSWAYWEFCAGFGVYDPQKAAWNTPLLRALLPQSAVK